MGTECGEYARFEALMKGWRGIQSLGTGSSDDTGH